MQTAELAALTFEVDEEILGSGPVRPPLRLLPTAGLVAAGGAVGSLLRFALQLIFPSTTTLTLIELPWGTLLANILGCLAIGVFAGYLEEQPDIPRWVRPAIVVGLLGGFTTFSSVILEGTAMLGANFSRVALTYAMVTVISALTGIISGITIGRVTARVRSRYRTPGGVRPVRASTMTPAVGVRLPRIQRPSTHGSPGRSTPGPRTERGPDGGGNAS